MFTKIINHFINLIFPYKCILCEKIIEDKDSLCSECWKKFNFIQKPFCNKCSTPFDYNISDEDICASCLKQSPLYIKARSAVIYNNDIAKIIFKFKFYDKIHLKRFMGKCMVKIAEDILPNIDIIIPIPLHKKRLVFRKYNQSLLLANEIASLTNKKVINNFLHKPKNTAPQATLRQSERRQNLKNKFEINKKYLNNIEKYKNLNFAIVDDVITTGSTINECIKIMREAGIKNVYALSFAKTVIANINNT